MRGSGQAALHREDDRGPAQGPSAIVIQLPIGSGELPSSSASSTSSRTVRWYWRGPGREYEIDMPADRAGSRRTAPSCSKKAVAETDEELLEKILGGEELTVAEIKAGIRKLTIASEVYPILCGSAFNKRCSRVVDYLHAAPNVRRSPATMSRTHRSRSSAISPSATEPFAALEKVAAHPFFGKLTMSGCTRARCRRAPRCSTRRTEEGAHREALPDARQRPSTRPRPATSTRSSGSRTSPPVTPCATQARRWCGIR